MLETLTDIAVARAVLVPGMHPGPLRQPRRQPQWHIDIDREVRFELIQRGIAVDNATRRTAAPLPVRSRAQ
jgi:hypothetical protein